MVSTRRPTSKSSSHFSNPLVTVPNAPIGIIVTCMFHSFFQFPSKVDVLILLFKFFQFNSVVSRDSKVYNFATSLFRWLLFGLVFWPKLGDPCVSQSPIGVYVCYFQWQVLGCAYYYYYYYSLIRAFHISVSRWFFIGVWVKASLLKSPGLFIVFWPFSTMLSFGWSPLVRQTPSPLVPLVIL